jgi:ABC-type Fe3+/spermidine/putrescine transport system ATPase subunit
MSTLSAKNISFARGGKPVLTGVDFEHESGQVLSILGASGSGKTTLLWLLAGLLKPDRGEINYAGDDSHHPAIGFVFQSAGLWEHLTVESHLDLVLRRLSLSRSDRRKRVERQLAETELTALAKRRPGQLSGGERQRLALARALVIQPRWLLLDEPTSQLDGPSRQALIELLERQLKRAANNAGIIMATHQVDQAFRLSDRVAVLIDGRIAQIGTPGDVYNDPVNAAVAQLTRPVFEFSSIERGARARAV